LLAVPALLTAEENVPDFQKKAAAPRAPMAPIPPAIPPIIPADGPEPPGVGFSVAVAVGAGAGAAVVVGIGGLLSGGSSSSPHIGNLAL
jgi:hypothetical protein